MAIGTQRLFIGSRKIVGVHKGGDNGNVVERLGKPSRRSEPRKLIVEDEGSLIIVDD